LQVQEAKVFTHLRQAQEFLAGASRLGCKVGLEKFGSGLDSFQLLAHFKPTFLKIDRSFTEAITRSPESDALIHTLVQLGKDLGLKTLAEGVENTSQIDHLRNEQVNQVQGFLLARPLDPQTLEERLIAPARTSEPGLSSSSGK
jgi:EAL domain-containing protein (putative c-di-GMP-specific phosphodiesterase class I)